MVSSPDLDPLGMPRQEDLPSDLAAVFLTGSGSVGNAKTGEFTVRLSLDKQTNAFREF